MSTVRCVAAAAALAFASMTASAGIISFNFPSPAASGAVLSIRSAGGPDAGLMVADQSIPLTMTIDARSEGLGIITFNNARMAMSITLPRATQTGANSYVSNISGSFAIYDYTGDTRVDILSGSLSGGQFLSNNDVHSMQMTTALGLSYTAGPRLASILGVQRQLVTPQNATFALTDVRTFTGGTQIIRPDLTYESFTATPSFTGDSQVQVIPTPGAAALASVGGLLTLRRRRR